jgi:hypothetical protein
VQDVDAGKIHGRAGVVVAVVGTLIMIAIAVGALHETFDHLLGPPASPSYVLVGPPDRDNASQVTDLHLLVTTLDETNGLLTIRVDGYQECRPTCEADEQLVVVALRTDELRGRHLPPAAIVPLPKVNGPVSQTVQLPVRIQAMRFPFDAFDLLLGLTLLQADDATGAQHRSAAEAGARMHVTLQSELPQMSMAPPQPRDAISLRTEEDRYEYFTLDSLRFSRWRAGQGLTVVLVLLIAAAAAYAVFLRPLHDLILSTGGLVIGVWGIRSILVPSNIAGRTGVDVALGLVILFLLGAMSIRVALLIVSPAHKRGAPRRSVERVDGARGRAEEPLEHGAGAHGD